MDITVPLSLKFIDDRIGSMESYDDEYGAVESFMLFRQLENVLFRIINNFTINITSGFKDFKRGELRAYQNSNHGDFRVLLKQNWMLLENTVITTPKAMKQFYSVSTKEVAYKLKQAKLGVTLDCITKCFAIKSNDITDQAANHFNETLTQLYKIWNTTDNNPIAAHDLIAYIDLKDRGQESRPANEVFLDVTDIRNTVAIVGSYELYFSEIIDDRSVLAKLEKSIDALITNIEQNTAISSNYLNALHKLISVFSNYLDAYSEFIQAAQILEHGLVTSLKDLVKKI